MSGKDREDQRKSEDDAEDVRLMRLVAQGDTSAFEEVIERHQALVAGTAARMLGSNSDVEDIAQQVFIRVWKSARRYVPRAKFTTWLLKITRNLVFNELRRAKRRGQVPLQSEPGIEEFPLKDETNPAPDASLLEDELQREIEEAIMQLPESQRMALVLRRYEQLSYEEIAEVLDLLGARGKKRSLSCANRTALAAEQVSWLERLGSLSGLFTRLNHTTLDTPDLGVMRERVDAPVASAKKRAQNPADNADDNCSPKGTPKTLHVKSDHDTGYEEEHQGIQDENEKTQRQQD